MVALGGCRPFTLGTADCGSTTGSASAAKATGSWPAASTATTGRCDVAAREAGPGAAGDLPAHDGVNVRVGAPVRTFAGTATLPAAQLGAGSHTITAAYGGA
jgi:hypothetical protein